jgi:uncharacterized protein YcfL
VILDSSSGVTMKIFLRSIATITLGSFILLGCANNIPPTTSGIGSSNMAQGDDFTKRLKVDNPELAKQLKIADVKSRNTNGLLEVNLELASTDKKSLKLQYHFNWFDADGFVIESRKTAWKPLELHGFQSTTLRGLAPSEQVTSFDVYVRKVPQKAYEF